MKKERGGTGARAAHLVLFLGERLLLDLQPVALPLQRVDVLRHAVELHAHVRARLIYQVDRLVRHCAGSRAPSQAGGRGKL